MKQGAAVFSDDVTAWPRLAGNPAAVIDPDRSNGRSRWAAHATHSDVPVHVPWIDGHRVTGVLDRPQARLGPAHDLEAFRAERWHEALPEIAVGGW
jgi:hypothetical protein